MPFAPVVVATAGVRRDCCRFFPAFRAISGENRKRQGASIDATREKTITVRNYWYGTSESATFACQAYAYGGSVAFTLPGQPKSVSFNMQNADWSIQLVCFNIPAGGGIANVNWNP